MYSGSIYLRKGTVYIPTWGMVFEGYYRVIEPVDVVPATDSDRLSRALHQAFERGNPLLPNLPRAELPPPILHKIAGARDWSTFAGGTLSWDINERNGIYEIAGKTKTSRGGFKPNPEQTITMPPGSTVDDVINRMITILQEATDAQQTRNKRRS